MAGQNFLVLYGIAAGVLAMLARTWWDRTLAVAVLLIVGALLVMQGAMLAYPIALFVVAAIVEGARLFGSPRAMATPAP